MGTAKEALGGGRAVGATEVIVVYSGERRKLAVAQSMAALVMQRQLTVPPLHPGRDRSYGQAHQYSTRN